MRDPFPPIPALSRAIEPLAERLGMQTLPLHIHEVVGAALLYTFIQVVVSPILSTRFFPQHYPRHDRAKKANWDTHVVSLVQSLLINVLALWVMFVDEERQAMDFEQRIWGYTGGCGLIQGLATGYFIWDLGITILNLDIFGLGLLAHAVSALAVYTLGFVRYPVSPFPLTRPPIMELTRPCPSAPTSTSTRPSSSSTSSPPPSSTSTGSSTNST
jgi:hypothetical protein